VLQSGVCAVCRTKVTRNQVFRVAAGSASGAAAHDPEFEALGKVRSWAQLAGDGLLP
jgi:hypothetical protein